MRLGIVLFDVFEVDSVRTKSGDSPLTAVTQRNFVLTPVQAFEIIVEHWVIMSNRSKIAFEVLYIHGIEPDKRRVESDVDFGEFLAQRKGSPVVFDYFLELVECSKDRKNVFVVCFLPLSAGARRDRGLATTYLDQEQSRLYTPPC